jgi:S1-C subfamily serine protease
VRFVSRRLINHKAERETKRQVLMMADEQGQAPSPFARPYRQPQYRQPQYGQSEYGQSGEGQQPTGAQPSGDPNATWYGQPQHGQPQYGQPQYGQPQQAWWMPQTAQHVQLPTPPQRKRRRTLVAIAAATAGVMMAAGFTAVAFDNGSGNNSQATSFTPSTGSSGNPNLPSWYGNGNSGTGSTGNGGNSDNSGGTGTGSGTATSAQSVGVVDINTVINYGSAEAAGTGIVLTSNGEILTNNHVIDGATSIKVTIVSTGKSYTATVVGDDPTDDVAVLQLSGASGLATAKLGDSSSVAVGNTVTAVGNAGGTGGTPSAATGTVTALNQSITATDEGGGSSENLTGMIEINADIQAGDSGGPLYSTSGTVIGIDTAASSQSFNSTTTGFAIPINKALTIAKQIESGTETSTIHIGPTAFLGVELGSGQANSFGSNGATISGVVDGSAAQQAGLAAGDTITAVNGRSVSSATDLSTALEAFQPGQHVTLTWSDSSGQSHSATVTLGSGPAD